MSEIKPALGSEEWASLQMPDPKSTERAIGAAVERAFNEARDHALAALVLYGQPFGFTWDDVDMLRGAADDGEWRVRLPLENIADRIAALLPPRDA